MINKLCPIDLIFIIIILLALLVYFIPKANAECEVDYKIIVNTHQDDIIFHNEVKSYLLKGYKLGTYSPTHHGWERQIVYKDCIE